MTEEPEELKELERQGYRLIDIVAGDVKPTKEIEYLVEKVVREKRGNFYSDLLYSLSSERFPEQKARELWQEILRHKYIMSEKLNRNVGIRVATLDYLENIKKIIEAPRIVEESDFAKTLKLSFTDPLTGLYNRRYFEEQLSELIALSPAQSLTFSLLMMDLDGFKRFNDREGHQAGDLILQEFSRILKKGLRRTDIISRYGGDEIVCILPSTNKFIARDIANKIREQVQNEFKEVGITLSAGISEFPVDAKDQESLVSQADAGLYRAKAFGGNAVAYFHPLTLTYRQENPQPREVSCVGDFNRWNTKKGRMEFDAQTGVWKIELNLLPGKYKYKFLIDSSIWITDPAQAERGDDGFGGECSVLTVKME